MIISSPLESIIVIPPHGVQLETRFGFQTFTINVTRRFIPLSTLRDVVINEGLYGWNVRYYLVAIVQDRSGATSLAVVFEVNPDCLHMLYSSADPMLEHFATISRPPGDLQRCSRCIIKCVHKLDLRIYTWV